MAKYICITGISSGIGLELTRNLIDAGYNVIGTVRNKAQVASLESIHGSHLKCVELDVTSEADMASLRDVFEALPDNEGLTAVINNAGYVQAGPLMYLEAQEIQHQLEVNLIGVHRVTRVAYPYLRRDGQGRIINMSSVSGIIANAFLGPYCASKFALEAYSDSLRRELLSQNIPVVIIQPGTIKTPIWEKNLGMGLRFEETEFSPLMKVADEVIRKSEKNALPPKVVSDVVMEALESSHPKTRYLVAKRAWRYRLIRRFVPDRWVDRLFQRFVTRKEKDVS